MSTAHKIINFVLFQAGWFACVLLGATPQHGFGTLVVALVIALHLASSPRRGPELRLILAALAIGVVWENLLALGHLTVYPSGQPGGDLAPVWIVMMWGLLATTLNVSLSWLRGRLLLSGLFGAIGGPLAFLAGARLGAVIFPDPFASLLVLAMGWALLMPLLIYLAGHFTDTRHRVRQARLAGSIR